MATFQNLVLSFLPRGATTAFVQRCYADSPDLAVDKAFRAKKVTLVTSDSMGRDDLQGLVMETALCMYNNACVGCFDLVVVSASQIPSEYESLVLCSLKPRGVACFIVAANSKQMATWFRGFLDIVCAYHPKSLVTMEPWNAGKNAWVVPVYHQD
jgi:hypothetical protein